MDNFSMPEKPKTMKGQVSVLWDIMGNHVLSSLRVQNLTSKFLLGLVGVNVTLSGLAIACVLMS